MILNPVYDHTRDEVNLAAKQRLESFKMGTGLPPTMNLGPTRPKSYHGRSHSRKSSVSAPTLSLSLSSNTLTYTNDTSSDATSNPPSKKRPTSHHRRRSSVSTRHESADLMGISLPEIPVSSSDDNINLGEKDSIRRRALLALEGKPDLAFAKVEIPELDNSDLAEKAFDFANKLSLPAGGGTGFSGSLRDSFKLLGASSKDQLHTLVEEEEEEEEVENKENIAAAPAMVPTPEMDTSAVSDLKASAARPRPPTLNLRPLSLNPENLVIANNGLPTPSSTPSSQRPLPPKVLSLVQSTPRQDPTPNRRHSLMEVSSASPPRPVARRPSLNIPAENNFSPDEKARKRSSISYKTSNGSTMLSFAGLPTPDATPTMAERRYSNSSLSSEEESLSRRPLSLSEQHFMLKSHNALLARITDLEHALSSQRRQSRPMSLMSDSSNSSSEPADEVMQLVADLKAERDELKKDADGWRKRVNDLDQQVGLFAQRIEAERRDAWVARTRVTLLEDEKAALEKALGEKTNAERESLAKYTALEEDFLVVKARMTELEEEKSQAELECLRLKAALEEEKARRQELELDCLATPTAQTYAPKVGIPCPPSARATFQLKSVTEEAEEVASGSDSGDALDGYEDEDSADICLQSHDSSSSFGSVGDFPRGAGSTESDMCVPAPSNNNGFVLSQTTIPKPAHAARRSLSTPWTFPRGRLAAAPPAPEIEEVDRFFGCLDESGPSPTLPTFASSQDASRSLFSQSLCDDADEMPPFVLPNHIGVEVEEPASLMLEPFAGEMEEGTIFGEEINGIRITFTPPDHDPDADFTFKMPGEYSPIKDSTPVYQGLEEEGDEEVPTFTPVRSAGKKPESSALRRMSSIPRRTVRPSDVPPETPAKSPAKRPSFIPQPTPSPKNVSSIPRAVSTTFIRQPQFKSMPVAAPKVTATVNANTQPTPPRRFPNFQTPATPNPRLGMMNVPISDTRTPESDVQDAPASPTGSSLSSFMSPFSTLRKLTNFMPLSWSPAAVSSLSPDSQRTTSPHAAYGAPRISVVAERKEPRLVSKEKQLEMLRSRLALERRNRGEQDARWG